MAYFLPHLHTAYAVDCAIQDETEKLVVIRFGHDNDKQCMLVCILFKMMFIVQQDETLMKIADLVKNFVVIYLVDITEVPEFNAMYELYDACTTMFFFRNKHMMIDLGTGNNNKINWALTSKDEMIAIMETIYRGAIKGRGIVISPFDYSARNKFQMCLFFNQWIVFTCHMRLVLVISRNQLNSGRMKQTLIAAGIHQTIDTHQRTVKHNG